MPAASLLLLIKYYKTLLFIEKFVKMDLSVKEDLCVFLLFRVMVLFDQN